MAEGFKTDLLGKYIEKDPDAVLDYGVNWAAWLGNDTIASSTWIIPAGITKDSDSITGATTTIWLSGGDVGRRYLLTNRITTGLGRTEDRSFRVVIKNK